MPAEAPTSQRRIEKHQGLVVGGIREVASIIVHAPYSIPRKRIPWERNSFSQYTVNHALNSVQSWLSEQPESQEAYRQIFGQDAPGERSARERKITFRGKGWNSITYSFDSNGRKWVVKIGSMVSPDGVFAINPRNERQSKELNDNLQILQDGMKEFGLPDFVSLPQVIHHTRFKNFAGIPEKRAVQIMPYDNILSLQDVVREVQNDPAVKAQLQGELERYSQLRRWLVKNHRLDFDLDGLDNVAVVKIPDPIDPKHRKPQYHLRVIDLGLRTHGLNTPFADAKQDIYGMLNSMKLRMAIAGEEPAKTKDIARMLGAYVKVLLGIDRDTIKFDLNSRILQEYVFPEIDIMAEGLFLRRGLRKEWLNGILNRALQIVNMSGDAASGNEDNRAA